MAFSEIDILYISVLSVIGLSTLFLALFVNKLHRSGKMMAYSGELFQDRMNDLKEEIKDRENLDKKTDLRYEFSLKGIEGFVRNELTVGFQLLAENLENINDTLVLEDGTQPAYLLNDMADLILKQTKFVNCLQNHLSPQYLMKEGLVESLRRVFMKDNDYDGVTLDIVANDTLRRYPFNLEIMMYRMCSALLINGIYHRDGSDILLEIKTDPDKVTLVYQDHNSEMTALDNIQKPKMVKDSVIQHAETQLELVSSKVDYDIEFTDGLRISLVFYLHDTGKAVPEETVAS
ncbi:hypothetical protein AB9P05_03380 [Roseivirga sp. BDSF3-8]|uniref:hypothetical protein n=1 Tax=Roseivirga sp. BDSF3-8 TaxID=3241598 RepID=UPI0035327902